MHTGVWFSIRRLRYLISSKVCSGAFVPPAFTGNALSSFVLLAAGGVLILPRNPHDIHNDIHCGQEPQIPLAFPASREEFYRPRVRSVGGGRACGVTEIR